MTTSYENYEWLLEADLSSYFGKWVAVIDKKVVAANKNIKELMSKVKSEYPHKEPLVTKVKSKLSVL